MRHILMLSGALAMAIAAPALAQGKSQGNGKDKGASAQMKGQGQDKSKGQDKGRAKDAGNDGNAAAKAVGQARKQARERASDFERANARRIDDARRDARDRADDFRDDDRIDARRDDVRRYRARRAAIEGCPPGLAKKRNGCMPPGQAKKIYQRNDRYAAMFDAIPYRYRDQSDGYRYGDGYLYRTEGNAISSWLPLLGGALGVGEIFPSNYASRSMPAYYDAYYGRNDDYAYRYADQAIFAVDPETQAIQSIAALLTGDDWTVGQPAPAGYGVYNVPLDYRDRYFDTPDANYRYADGRVYRIDPTTQLVAAAISLLT